MYIYDENGKFIAEAYENNIEKIKQQFEDKEIYLSNIDLGEKAIVENGNVRAMTRLDKIKSGEENLLDGEYVENDEIFHIEKPSNFYIWDSKTNKWNYDKELEINALDDELANLESTLSSKYDELDKAISRKLKTLEKRLNTEIEELSVLIDEKYIKLEELEG